MKFSVKFAFILSAGLLFICLLQNPASASIINKESQDYREKGFKAQAKKDFPTAIVYYQKAVELDPYYAPAWNDLGVAYEAMGWLKRAEAAYLKCIDLDPDFLSPYFNLGALYEKQGNLRKAAQYYKKRVLLSYFSDSWTVKSKERILEIAEELPDIRHDLLELEALEMSRQISQTRIPVNLNPASGGSNPEHYINKGNTYYAHGDYLLALREYSFAVQLDPRNKEADRLLKNAQRMVLVNPK